MVSKKIAKKIKTSKMSKGSKSENTESKVKKLKTTVKRPPKTEVKRTKSQEITKQVKMPEIVTDSGFPVKVSYYRNDILKRNSQDEKPGKFPFTRGIHDTMYRQRSWTMRQYSGFGSAEETNNRFKFLLEKGQTGLSLAFDLPTQTGRDSDDIQSEGEVGRTGVAISSVDDMLTCFNGIPLDKVSTSMTINSTASTLLALYITVAESQGVSPMVLRGTI